MNVTPSRYRQTRAARLFAAAIAACAIGCANSEGRLLIAELHVTSTGQYLLRGQAVSGDNLTSRLKELRASSQSLELTIRADSTAKSDLVEGAINAVREAGISRVSFTNSESTK